MKKIMSYIAITALVLTFTACGNKDNEVVNNNLSVEQEQVNVENNVGQESNTEINNEEVNKVEENKPAENKPVENKPVENKPVEEKPAENKPEENKPVEEKPAENKPEENKPVEEKPVENKPVENKPVEELPAEKPVEILTKNATEILSEIITDSNFLVNAPFTQEIDSEMSLTTIGLDETQFNTYVDNAVMYESMMMPSNQSLCIIKLKDATKGSEVKQLVFDNCNPRKWICMSAEYVLVTDNGQYVMLIMSTKDNCNLLNNSFKNVLGSASEALERSAE